MDAADLLALVEDGETTTAVPIICTCTDKCTTDAASTACPVYEKNMGECVVKVSEPVVPDKSEPEPREEKGGGADPILIVLLLLATGGDATFYFCAETEADTEGFSQSGRL